MITKADKKARPSSIMRLAGSEPLKSTSRLSSKPGHRILDLQRTIGNQAVQNLLKTGVIQAKLAVSEPDDAYEREADKAADQVMRMQDPQTASLEPPEEEEKPRRRPLTGNAAIPIMMREPEEKEENLLQTCAVSREKNEVAADTETRITALRGGGSPLPGSVMNFMEPRFGADFTGVRVHTGGNASDLARSVNAHAFTIGRDIVFGHGKYQPETESGKRLLAHELTHVAQQDQAAVMRGMTSLKRKADAAPDLPVEHQRDARTRPGSISRADLAANLGREYYKRFGSIAAGSPVRFRLPTTADLKAVFTGGNVSESVLKNSITMALTRMKKEGRLKTADTVPVIIGKVFPSPGTFNEIEYEKVVDVKDRGKIYQNIMDAQTKVAAGDKPKLATAMSSALKLIDQCAKDDFNLNQVFGAKKSTAKTVYNNAKTALDNVSKNIDTAVTTDYNRDDPEIGLGGWAKYSSQELHLEPAVAKAADPIGAQITLIHEACHLADPSVKDYGYYGSKGFEDMSEDDKVTNAAHFEEIPRRKVTPARTFYGTTYVFKPKPGGVPSTFQGRVKRQTAEYLRKTWDKAVDVHLFLRKTRTELLSGSSATFNAKKTRIMELSKLMNLTIHQQPASSATINPVDIVLAEGIARGTAIIEEQANKMTVPSPPTESESFYARKIIDDSIKAYNALTGTFADDKKLIEWLEREYKKPF